MLSIATTILLLTACFQIEDTAGVDADGDGVPLRGDCDDSNPNIHPDNEELCNGIDDDCDTMVDEGVMVVVYLDDDGDGFGAGEAVESCASAAGYVMNDTDCDDSNAAIHPEANDECDGIDDDCNGVVDDGAIGGAWFVDADSDGFGDPDNPAGCTSETGLVGNGDDCDDTNADVNPDADEQCGDGMDNDCNGITDTDSGSLATLYEDEDGDGYGAGTAQEFCVEPSGWVEDDGDCDDLNFTVFPGASELCDGLDNDCDGLIDDSAPVWYSDGDGDGYGDPDGLTVQDCTQPSSFVSNFSDCNDSDFEISPGAIEVCNGIDDDCSGIIDDNLATAIWWSDADGDGFGDEFAPSDQCDPGAGYVQNIHDCDDSAADVNPLGTELCANKGVDNDCDGDATEPAVDPTRWYPDDDDDGYGDEAATGISQCVAPANYVNDDTDCDDTMPSVNPGEIEVCNFYDDDCDGDADSDAVDKTTHYVDSDMDGYGSATATVQACQESPGITTDNTDCDDTLGIVYPGATEYCNGIDDNCNGLVDEPPSFPASWYYDGDGDGYGTPFDTITSCSPPFGYVLDDRDCDDSRVGVNPSAQEVCNGRDDDCDGDVDDEDTSLAGGPCG